ncbi:hypothetical protein C9374_002606 [Naegleria lovaniensis]|uniref:Retropepsin-like aspartic endopeptidase domain-containing protein n=1 Tax=Naegleria lovaniensis TaxID=51637 RepID=A0AA88GSP9_NAELO|nr:uncharacterized protein C9374_002606 [Naegleria lovaniensis]KAG2386160.1 hypothetical protein C9374_002606 [Naegleria lovaniensis]
MLPRKPALTSEEEEASTYPASLTVAASSLSVVEENDTSRSKKKKPKAKQLATSKKDESTDEKRKKKDEEDDSNAHSDEDSEKKTNKKKTSKQSTKKIKPGMHEIPNVQEGDEEGRDELSQRYRPIPSSIATFVKPLEPKTRIIGRQEMIHFPQLGVMNLLGKVDSGAKTSCLDVVNVHHDTVKKTLNFDVVLDRNNRNIVRQVQDFPFANTTKTVMSSNGHVSTRYVIKTLVSIGPEFREQVAEFTLVERHKLACPVLIGRNVIRMGEFLVDCNKKFVTGKKAKQKLRSLFTYQTYTKIQS